MSKNECRTILVVDDVEETLDGIEALLKHDGYRVYAARDEQDATNKARFNSPDLMLVSLDGEIADVIAAANRIRERAALNDNLPIIIFCVGELKEGGEFAVGHNIYLAHPDNFNQLRKFIADLLLRFPSAAQI
jgi:two-component system alkaline phosphatase synthesis response regulator PhoP